MKKIFLIIIGFWLSLTLKAQNNTITLDLPTITPVSPEAASVAQYANYPVDYSVGLPEIKVPLYEIKEGEITLPIYLSYHASGLKPKETSGWVGTGWTLMADPSVMRTIRGLPDDGNGGYLNHHDCYERQIQMDRQKEYLDKMLSGQIDGEPDQFSYRLLDGGGSFYANARFRNTETMPYQGFITQPFRPLDINNVGTHPINSFYIQDENGLRYEFGGGDGYYEYAGDRNTITRWLCKSIKPLYSNKKITFSYGSLLVDSKGLGLWDAIVVEDKGDDPRRSKGNILSETINGRTTRYSVVGNEIKIDPNQSDEWSVDRTPLYNSHYYYMRNLSEISFGTGKVTFTTDGRNLKYIRVYDKEGNLIKQIEFFITKYNSTTHLYKLDAIAISGNNSPVQRYTFQYNDPNNVPDMATKGVDHWGYYNGANNESAVPRSQQTIEVQSASGSRSYVIIGKADRESSEAMNVGVLKAIKSPEGVDTYFTYEANRYGYYVTTSEVYETLVGGLRIKRIEAVDIEDRSCKQLRIFDYGGDIKEGADSDVVNFPWGIPKRRVLFNDYGYTQKKVEVDQLGSHESRLRIWNSDPIRSITYNNGSSILYHCVTETVISKNPESNQIIKYYYKTPHEWSYAFFHYYIHFLADFDLCEKPFDETETKEDFKYGQLIRKEIYKDKTRIENGMYKPTLVQETTYDWSFHKWFISSFTDHCDRIPGYNYSCRNVLVRNFKAYHANSVISSVYTPSGYREDVRYVQWWFANGSMRMDKETVTDYFEDDTQIQTIKEFTYDDCSHHMNPIHITTTTSDGGMIEESFRYPEDMIVQAANIPDYEDLGQSDLLSGNMLNKLLEYKRITNNDTVTYRTKYQAKPECTKVKSHLSNEYEERIRYHKYDYWGNPAYITKDDATRVVYIWSYGGEYLIAEIQQATYQDVVTALGGDSYVNTLSQRTKPLDTDWSKLNALRNALPQSFVTLYKYKPLVGISEIIDTRGFSTYYDYDGLGRLKEVYIKSATNEKEILEHYDIYLRGQ